MYPEVTIVVIAHQNEAQLLSCIQAIQNQTQQNKEILVYYSGIEMDSLADENVHFFNQPDRNDWGQEKAAHGLNAARGKYVCFMNIDDEYKNTYLMRMYEKAEAEELDLVYCDFVNKERTIILGQPKLNIGTRGMFLVRSEFARSVGYNHRDYGADGRFLEELVEAGAKHARLEEVLYIHK